MDDFSVEAKQPNYASLLSQPVSITGFPNWLKKMKARCICLPRLERHHEQDEFVESAEPRIQQKFGISAWRLVCSSSMLFRATYGTVRWVHDDHGVVNGEATNPYGRSKTISMLGHSPKNAPLISGRDSSFSMSTTRIAQGPHISVVSTPSASPKTGGMNLFRSHRPEYQDGHQTQTSCTSKMFNVLSTSCTTASRNIGTLQSRKWHWEDSLDPPEPPFQPWALNPTFRSTPSKTLGHVSIPRGRPTKETSDTWPTSNLGGRH